MTLRQARKRMVPHNEMGLSTDIQVQEFHGLSNLLTPPPYGTQDKYCTCYYSESVVQTFREYDVYRYNVLVPVSTYR